MRDGKLDCKAVYQVLRPKGEVKCWGSFLWSGLQSRKWSFFMWLALQNRLYTADRLLAWGVIHEARCVFCACDESASHLFFECPYSKCVLDYVLRWVRIGVRPDSLGDWMRWFDDSKSVKTLMFQTKLLALNATVYYVWEARNKALQESVYVTVEKCASSIVHACILRVKAK